MTESTSGQDTPVLPELMRRLQSLEDQLTIHRIIMTHPPAADTGEGDFWHVMFGENGRCNYPKDLESPGGLAGLATPDQLTAWTNDPDHVRSRQSGYAHVAGAPIVVVAGDEAQAWNYHQTIVRTEEGFRLVKLYINHWEFARSAQGWQVTMRTVRPINGDEEALDILRGAVSASSALMG